MLVFLWLAPDSENQNVDSLTSFKQASQNWKLKKSEFTIL